MRLFKDNGDILFTILVGAAAAPFILAIIHVVAPDAISLGCDTVVKISEDRAAEATPPHTDTSITNKANLFCYSNDIDTGELIRPLKMTSDLDAWWEDTSYVLRFRLPESVSVEDGLNGRMRVYYPEYLGAGDEGKIIMKLTMEDGHAYQAAYEFEAKDNLCLIFGDEDPVVASGGDMNVSKDGKNVDIAFYTSATRKHKESRRSGIIGRTSTNGEVDIEFSIYDSLTEPEGFDTL